jgi:hypothetical protein
MEINLGQPNKETGISSRGGKIAEGSTVIDMQNLKKKSDFIDQRGNKINPVTKQIIEKSEPE